MSAQPEVKKKLAILTASSGLIYCSLLSRVLGLVRDIMLAWIVGSGLLGDLLAQALRIPHIFRRLLADGTFSLHLTKVFVKSSDPAQLYRIVERRYRLLFCAFTVVFACCAPWISFALAGNAETETLTCLLRLVSVYFFCVGMAALGMSFLQAHRIFWVSAAAPILFNLVLLSILFIQAVFCERASVNSLYLVVCAFSLGGGVQWLWHRFFVQRCQTSLSVPARTGIEHVRFSFFSAHSLTVFAASAYHLVLFLCMLALARLGEGQVAALFYAERLIELPLGVISVCFGMVSLPLFAVCAQKRQFARFRHILDIALHWTLVFVTPCLAGLFAVGEPIVLMLFCHGQFDTAGALRTWCILKALLPLIPLIAVNRVLLSACVAQDMLRFIAMATLLALATTGLALVLNFFPPTAATIGIAVQTTALFCFVRRLWIGEYASFSGRFWATILCTAFGTFCAARGSYWLTKCLFPDISLALHVFSAITFGAFAWFIVLRMLAPRDWSRFYSRFCRRRAITS